VLPRADYLTAVDGGGCVRTKRNSREYEGALASQIAVPSSPTFEGAVTEKRVAQFRKEKSLHQRKVQMTIKRKRLEKLPLLFDHYGIENRNDIHALVLALAIDHVPGFKTATRSTSRRGRRLKWSLERLLTLLKDVRDVRLTSNFNDKRALQHIATNPQFANAWGFPPNRESQSQKQKWIETLQSRLNDAKRLDKLLTESTRKANAELEAAASNLKKKFRK
jgi:hypothetical protein